MIKHFLKIPLSYNVLFFNIFPGNFLKNSGDAPYCYMDVDFRTQKFTLWKEKKNRDSTSGKLTTLSNGIVVRDKNVKNEISVNLSCFSKWETRRMKNTCLTQLFPIEFG